MRELASLLFVAALAARVGLAGAPSSEPSPTCAGEAAGEHAAAVDTHLTGATPLVTSAERLADGVERTSGGMPRRAAARPAPVPLTERSGPFARPIRPRAPLSLQGFPAHPSTAPPQRF